MQVHVSRKVMVGCVLKQVHICQRVTVTMSTSNEISPLLSKSRQEHFFQKCCSCNIKYRLPKITEKGAIVLIVCNVLALIATFAQSQRMFVTTNTAMAMVVLIIITSPIAGFVVDTCIGKFKAIQASIVLLMLSSFLAY